MQHEPPAPVLQAVVATVKERFRSDHMSINAAGVAFFGFLALVPTFAAVVSVYGLVADPDDVRTRMQELLSSAPPEMTQLLTDQLTRLTESSSASLGLGLVISVAIALWSASSGVAHLLEGIGIAYDRHDDGSPVALRLNALLVTLAVVVVAAIAVGVLGFVGSLDPPSPALRWGLRALSLVGVAALFVLVISVLYRNGGGKAARRSRPISPGAVVALVCWVTLTAAFGIYVSNFGSYDQTYGSLASIVILLLWLYLSATVVLLGALIDAALRPGVPAPDRPGPPRPAIVEG